MKTNSFRTEINLQPEIPIELKDRILTTGSCFADQFGQWLANFKFNVQVNPFGTSYNPVSIHKGLMDSATGYINKNFLIEHLGIWYHYDYHSQWSATSKEQLLESIKKQQQHTLEFIKKASVIIITYGTAWVYELNEDKHLVNNCHKQSSKLFTKQLLSVEQIIQSFESLHQLLLIFNPNMRVMLTVSPVRHVKDTLSLNSVSKATLRLACHQLSNRFSHVEYFPSFELMMDDLRDYRFYERDRIHPTGEALEYIFSKFSDQYFSKETQDFIHRWSAIKQSLEHRAYHPASAAHQLFLTDLLHKLEALKEIVNVEQEINYIQSQIHQHG